MRKAGFRSLGLMSGTSLDGLDMALCEFILNEGAWNFRIIAAETCPYDNSWKMRLSGLHKADALTFWRTHIEYGRFLGEKVKDFLIRRELRAELVCSHGHTVFHRPGEGFTMQAGAGEVIAAVTGLPVISDLRSADLALGGQGAPLVPAGDKLLFPSYDACLNIGGFSNVSMDWQGNRIAFDICPSNIIFNHLAALLGREYDRDGNIARKGKLNVPLFEKLNRLPYYSGKPPKSLGREWLEECFLPILSEESIDAEDLLRTVTEHAGYQIGRSLKMLPSGKILVTGGGAYNSFLLDCISRNSHHHYIIPENLLVDYKEALVFAFLGVLRSNRKINVFSSVTGAARDHSGGASFNLFPE